MNTLSKAVLYRQEVLLYAQITSKRSRDREEVGEVAVPVFSYDAGMQVAFESGSVREEDVRKVAAFWSGWTDHMEELSDEELAKHADAIDKVDEVRTELTRVLRQLVRYADCINRVVVAEIDAAAEKVKA